MQPPPAPAHHFGALAGCLASTLRKALARSLFVPCSSPPSTLCMARPRPVCVEDDCDWVRALLRAVVPPALARAAEDERRRAARSFMDALVGEEETCAADARRELARYPAADRVVAVGDVHGDLEAMKRALRNAGVIDTRDAWVGGKTVLVQVGDQLDRGEKEREIYELLFRLQDAAPVKGGSVHILLGNHELMNTRLDFRYVTKGGFHDFERGGGVTTVFGMKRKPQIPPETMRNIRALPNSMRARAKALCAGGPLAMELAERSKVSVIVGDSIFVHGGLNTKHLTHGGRDARKAVETLFQLNKDVKRFLLGKADLPVMMRGGSSPVWLRDYSKPSVRQGSAECRMLAETLRMVNAKRMVVGHTPQAEGINSACGGKVWRIDTGMSSAYGGVPEAIEITKRGAVRIYTPKGVVQGSARYK